MSHPSVAHGRRAFTRILLFVALLAGLLCTAATPLPQRTGPQTMPPHPRLKDGITTGQVKEPKMQDQIAPEASLSGALGVVEPMAITGQLKALAVLVDFSDQVQSTQATFFDNLLFAAPVAGRGSVRDYYNDVSYGQVDVVAVTLPSALGWKRAPQTKGYYVDNNYCTDGGYPNDCRKLAEDVVDAINSVVDFKQYDNNGDGTMEPIMLIHAGPGAEYTGSTSDIWSHSWYLYNTRNYDGVTINRYVIMPEYWGTGGTDRYDMTIGVFVHEMGHGYWNLPDLYDTDGTSEGIGNWSLMAAGSWNGSRGLGDSPAWPDAWSRIKMGYTSATTVAANATGMSIPKVTTSNTGTIFKLANGVLGAKEYFLLENREKTAGSYDEYLPGSGLAIWHVDDAVTTGNQKECKLDPCSGCGSAHYQVALEQSDGLRDLEYARDRGDNADVFPGSTSNKNWSGATHPESGSYFTTTPTNISVTNISAAADTMTADVAISGSSTPQPSISINDVSVNEGNSGSTSANFTVSLSAASSSTITVKWATAGGTATSGTDFTAGSGTLSFSAGQTSKMVTVAVKGDTAVESNESFYVNLSSPTNATIADSQGVGTIVNDDTAPVLHVGDLDGKRSTSRNSWSATVTITVHNANHATVSSAKVTGTWAGSGSYSCTTGTAGTCTITKSSISTATPSIVFTVTGVTKSGTTYNASANHDPDGDSNGTSITITK